MPSQTGVEGLLTGTARLDQQTAQKESTELTEVEVEVSTLIVVRISDTV